MSIWSSPSPFTLTGQPSSKSLPSLDTAAAGRPERQRGLWNFLTWSFFLANFLTATEVAGGAAHAAATTDGNMPNAPHADDTTAQASTSQHPGIDSPALEHASSGFPVPESEGRLATNLIAPSTISPAQSADISASDTSVAHPAPFTSGVAAIYQTEADTQTDHTDTGGHTGGDGTGTTTIVDHVVSTVVETVGDVVGPATHLVGDVVGEVGHAAASLVSALGDTVDTSLHAVTSTLASPSDLITSLPSSVETIASSLDHVLTTAVTAAVQAPLDILHAAATDLGIAAPGSLNFSTATTEHSLVDAPNTYSQYNLSVQDVASAESHVMSSDTGSITSIITSALGIGHLPSSDQTSSDHSSDHQSSLHVLNDDLNGSTHHNLLG